MPNLKISQFTNLAGLQVPTDVIPVVVGSAAPNYKTTINDLFADLGQNVTSRGIALTGVATGSAPSVSAASKGKFYYDTTLNELMLSKNTGAYSPISSGSSLYIPTSTFAALPAAPSLTQLYKVTDTNRGLWYYDTAGAQWISDNGNVYDAKAAGAKGDGVTDDRAALNTLANTTIPATGGTIWFPPGTYNIGSAITFPVGVQLKFSQGAKLLAPNGVTVNINGTIDASSNQLIFSWSGTGHFTFGGVDNTSGTSTASQMNPAAGLFNQTVLIPQWWGVKGDYVNGVGGTDDTTAWQRIFNILPNYACLIIPPNTRSRITATLTLYNRLGVRIDGSGRVGDQTGTGDASPQFIWDGADGGTVLDFARLQGCLFEGFYINGNAANSSSGIIGAAIGIWLEQVNGTAGNISSANLFRYINIYPNTRKPTWTACYIGDVSGNNNEYHAFEYCSFYGSTNDTISSSITGTGVYLAHSNVKQITFRNCTLKQARYGIHCVGGSFVSLYSNCSFCETIYNLDSWTDKILILGDDSEYCGQLVTTGLGQSGSSPVEICNGRYDRDSATTDVAIVTNPFIDLSGAAITASIHDNFLGYFFQTSNNTWYTDHKYILKGNSGGVLTFDRNTYREVVPQLLSENFLTFGQVVVDGSQFYASPTVGTEGGISAITSGSLIRSMIKIQECSSETLTKDGRVVGTVDYIQIGDGHIQLNGLGNPNTPAARVIGTGGATQYYFAIVALDAGGNKTFASITNGTTAGNAVLDGTNYIALSWPAVPGASSYDIINMNNADGAQFRLVANTASTSYNVQANPVGAYTYTRASNNQTLALLFRGAPSFCDPVDNTKIAAFVMSTIATGTTRTFTFPNTSGTFALTSDVPVINPTDGAVPYRSNATTFADTPLVRIDANTVAQRNGTNAQTFSLYTTYTDAANNKSLDFYGNFSGGNPGIWARGDGTGGDPNLIIAADGTTIDFRTGGSQRWQILNGNFITASSDNTLDIGALGATRPRTGYFGTSLVAPTGTFITALNGGVTTITSASASALAVGASGLTNPVLQVDASTASVATGIKITGAAALAGVTIAAISSGANEDIFLTPKGTGAVQTILAGNQYKHVWGNTVVTSALWVGTDSSIGTTSNHAFNLFTNGADRINIDTSGNVGIGVTAYGTSAAKVLGIGNGTAPTTSPADMAQLYVKDAAAGDAQLFARNEASGIARLTGCIAYVTAQFDKTASAALADVTGLALNVEAATRYGFEALLFVDADATGGSKYSISGTASVTSIIYEVELLDDSTNVLTIADRSTTYAGAGAGQAGTTAGRCILRGSVLINTAGTFVPQFAQNAANATSSVLVGSYFKIWQS